MILDSILKELEQLKRDNADWCSDVSSQIENLEKNHGITISSSRPARRDNSDGNVESLIAFRDKVATPYINALLDNIRSRFSDEAVNLLVSSSVFNPASLPSDESTLADYGKKELRVLAEFYGCEATVIYGGVTFSSPPLISKDDVLMEWHLFKRALVHECKVIREEKKTSKEPSLQDVKSQMEASTAYTRDA